VKAFCDLDGTLIDVAPRHYRVYAEVTQVLGGEPLEQQTYWARKRQKTRWPELLHASKLASDVEQDFLARFIDKIEAPAYLEQDALFPGARDALELLAERATERYLVSLRRQPTRLMAQLERLDVMQFFTDVLSGHSDNDGSDVKIELIGGKLTPPHRAAIVIGDTEADIAAGKHLGLTTVAVTSGIRDDAFLRALEPDYLLDSVGQLASVLAAIE